MSVGRYTFVAKVRDFTTYSTSDLSARVFFAVQNGAIPYNTQTVKQGERLDTIAGKAYGSGTLWWIIAAASGIGWSPQVPPGTLIKIPTDLSGILSLSRA